MSGVLMSAAADLSWIWPVLAVAIGPVLFIELLIVAYQGESHESDSTS